MVGWLGSMQNGRGRKIDMLPRSLFSFGDSFTYGTELLDCGESFSNHTWPALIAKELGCQYQCYAQGGVGNQRISLDVVSKYSHSTFKNRNLYVINWTWIERFDYYDIDCHVWRTIYPRAQGKLSHFFYKHLDHHAWNLLRNLQMIHSTIQVLRAHDCDFFMTCIDNSLLGTNYAEEFTPAIADLQDLVRPYINKIEETDFLTWCEKRQFDIGPGGHPLEEAHAAAAEHWSRKIKHQLRVVDRG